MRCWSSWQCHVTVLCLKVASGSGLCSFCLRRRRLVRQLLSAMMDLRHFPHRHAPSCVYEVAFSPCGASHTSHAMHCQELRLHSTGTLSVCLQMRSPRRSLLRCRPRLRQCVCTEASMKRHQIQPHTCSQPLSTLCTACAHTSVPACGRAPRSPRGSPRCCHQRRQRSCRQRCGLACSKRCWRTTPNSQQRRRATCRR